jgi:hypothetical protein
MALQGVEFASCTEDSPNTRQFSELRPRSVWAELASRADTGFSSSFPLSICRDSLLFAATQAS